MKKLKWMLLMVAAVFTFAACDEDENDVKENENIDIHDLSATVTGWTEGSCQYFAQKISDGDQMTIKANEDGKTATVTYASSTWGNASFNNVEVTVSDNNYTVAGKGTVKMGMHGGEANDYDATLSGSVAKDFKMGEVVINVPAVMGGLKLVFRQGKAPVGYAIEGEYAGYTNATSEFFPNNYSDNDTVKIEANTDGSVNLTLVSTVWGTMTFAGVTVTSSDNGFSFGEGTGKTTLHGSEYDALLTSGQMSADKESYTFVVSLPSLMRGTTLTFQQGNAPEEEVTPDGHYRGYSSASCQYFENRISSVDQVIIVKNDDDTYTVTFRSTQFGTATFDNVVIVVEEDQFMINGATGHIAMGQPGSEETNEYDALLNYGTISLDKKEAEMQIQVPGVMEGMTILFHTGDAPEE